MPSRVHNPAKPTLYPDTSTLCDAYLAGNGLPGASPDHAPLYPWLAHVAQDANLCLSIVHLGELARWMKTTAAEGVAKWLDALPIVWTIPLRTMQDAEVDYWVQVALDQQPSAPFVPFASSFASSFADMKLEGTTDLFRDPTMVRLLQDSRQVDWEKYRNAGFDQAKRFRDDRAEMKRAGGTREQLARRVEENRRKYLNELAAEAHQRLRGKPGYTMRIVSEVQQRFVALVESNPKAVPGIRVGWAYDAKFVVHVEERTEGSKKEREQLPGTFGDRTHAHVGGGYCDVFTCDLGTATDVAGARSALGFPHTFAPGQYPGGLAKYVADLTSLI